MAGSPGKATICCLRRMTGNGSRNRRMDRENSALDCSNPPAREALGFGIERWRWATAKRSRERNTRPCLEDRAAQKWSDVVITD